MGDALSGPGCEELAVSSPSNCPGTGGGGVCPRSEAGPFVFETEVNLLPLPRPVGGVCGLPPDTRVWVRARSGW